MLIMGFQIRADGIIIGGWCSVSECILAVALPFPLITMEIFLGKCFTTSRPFHCHTIGNALISYSCCCCSGCCAVWIFWPGRMKCLCGDDDDDDDIVSDQVPPDSRDVEALHPLSQPRQHWFLWQRRGIRVLPSHRWQTQKQARAHTLVPTQCTERSIMYCSVV